MKKFWTPANSLCKKLAVPSPFPRCRPYTVSASLLIHAPKRHIPIDWDATEKDYPIIAKPTPFVPDVKTFLTLIGRDSVRFSSKLDWQTLFEADTEKLQDLGVEPSKSRRYLIWWRDRFRFGIYGIGGDCRHVRNGVAELHLVEEILPQGNTKRYMVNPPLPPEEENSTSESDAAAASSSEVDSSSDAAAKPIIPDQPVYAGPLRKAHKKSKLVKPVIPPVLRAPPPGAGLVKEVRVIGTRCISGKFVKMVKGTGGTVAHIRVQDGLWNVTENVKVDGGERRKRQIRRLRLIAERNKMKDAKAAAKLNPQ